MTDLMKKIEIEVEVEIKEEEEREEEEKEEEEGEEEDEKEPVTDEEIEDAALEAEHELKNCLYLHGRTSTEGLASAAGRVVRSLTDFLIKMISNLKTTVTGIFKKIKRSELQAFISSHRTNYMKLKNTEYSKLYKVMVEQYSFTETPSAVGSFFLSSFNSLGMKKRFDDILEQYMVLNANLRGGDIDQAQATIKRIEELNAEGIVKGVDKRLKELVVVRPPKKLGTIGDAFNSTEDIIDAVETTLKGSGELDIAMTISSRLEKLYKTFEKLGESLQVANTKGVVIGKLKGVTSTIKSTGTLLTTYAMMVQEYHHLEHYLTSVIDAGVKAGR